MKTLNRQDEQKLIQAVKEAVTLVDDEGNTPDQALEKVARAQKWGKDMVKFASYAYNTGRQTAQREASTSILSKLAEFPIADADAIIDQIWPANVKSAVEIAMATSVSQEYDGPPSWPADIGKDGHIKVAADLDMAMVDEPPAPYEPDPNVKMARTFNAHLQHKKAAEEARHQAAMAKEAAIGAMGRLAAHFQHRPAGIDEAFQVAQLYDYGSKTALDKLYAFVVQRNSMGKIVQAEDGGLSREPQQRQAVDVSGITADHSAAPYALIKACIDTAAIVHVKEAAHEDALAAMKKQAEDLRPFVGTSASTPNGPFSLLPKSEKQAMGWVGAGLAGGATKSLLDRALADMPAATSELEEAQLSELESPEHEAELRKIRAQALIAEMMEDEVIGAHEPEKVLRAYNELSQMAPQTAMQPMAMRSLMRRHLQGSMEPFETKEITEIEKGLRETDQQPKPSLIGAAPQNVL